MVKYLAISAPENQRKSLFIIQDRSSSQPYLVEFQANGQPLTMEVYTVSLAPESVLVDLPSATLQPNTTVLRTYTGETIPVKGTILVNVQYAKI